MSLNIINLDKNIIIHLQNITEASPEDIQLRNVRARICYVSTGANYMYPMFVPFEVIGLCSAPSKLPLSYRPRSSAP